MNHIGTMTYIDIVFRTIEYSPRKYRLFNFVIHDTYTYLYTKLYYIWWYRSYYKFWLPGNVTIRNICVDHLLPHIPFLPVIVTTLMTYFTDYSHGKHYDKYRKHCSLYAIGLQLYLFITALNITFCLSCLTFITVSRPTRFTWSPFMCSNPVYY